MLFFGIIFGHLLTAAAPCSRNIVARESTKSQLLLTAAAAVAEDEVGTKQLLTAADVM